MYSTRKTLTRGWLGAMLAVALAAGSAGAASHKKPQNKQATCMQHCNESNQEKMRTCVASCPKPRPGKMEEFQACSQRCSANLKTDACYARCEPGEGKHQSH